MRPGREAAHACSLSILCACIQSFLILTPVQASDLLMVLRENDLPVRVANGPEDMSYVSNAEAHAVFIHDAALQLTGELRALSAPLGIAVDAQGWMYVGNDGDDHIRVYHEDGSLRGVFAEGLVSKPNDLAFDFDRRLYVADSERNQVLVFNSGGHLVDTIGSPGSGDGQLTFPAAVTVAYTYDEGTGQPVGELFVADQGNFRIQVFDLAGSFLRTYGSLANGRVFGGKDSDWQGRFVRVTDLVVDARYRVHALDSYLATIQILDAQDGSFISSYGEFGSGTGELNLPLGFALDDAGRAVVADNGNRRVVEFSPLTNDTVALSPAAVDEGVPPGATVGVLQTLPAPAGPVTYLLVPGHGDTDNASFSISGSNLVTTATFDREIRSTCRIRVKAVHPDSPNLAQARQLTVTVGDVNEAPQGVILDDYVVNEGEPAGTPVGGLITIDPDIGDSFTYTLIAGSGDDDNGEFTVAGSALQTAAEFDYETRDSYSVRIRSQDSGGAAVTGVLAITVRNVNEITGGVDTDGDGIDDWFEYNYTGSTTALQPGNDEDQDGASNLDEWVSNTHPDNALQYLLLYDKLERTPGGHPVLRWISGEDRYYDIFWTTNLVTGPLVLLDNGVEGTPPENTYTDALHVDVERGYYLIRAKLTP